MGIQDLLVTPVYLIILFLVAYMVRPYFTDRLTRKFFIPGLAMKFLGAISLGCIYQFYYHGGDTFNYWTHGSAHIFNAFLDSPAKGWEVFIGGHENYLKNLEYTGKIWYYHDSKSYFIVRIAAFFDLFTFHTYSATALFFALFSFSGVWAMFSAFQKIYPKSTNLLAVAFLFLPSVFFWGSGILKDSITLGALGWLTFSFFQIVIFKQRYFLSAVILIVSSFMILSIKLYILLSFLAAICVYYFSISIKKVKSSLLKILFAPVLSIVILGVAYLSYNRIVASDSKYALENIAKTAQITSYDIRYGWGARTGEGSGYTLGELDGSFQSMLKLGPSAINVSLFRPYLWEVSNPLMLVAAVESFFMLVFSIALLFSARNNLKSAFSNPELRFCLFFSLIFAFAVGISTANFGTLMRYKIPMMPFYVTFLIILNEGNRKIKRVAKSDSRKGVALES